MDASVSILRFMIRAGKFRMQDCHTHSRCDGSPTDEKSSVKDSNGDELGQKYLENPQESKLKTSRSYDLIAVYQDNKERWTFKFDNGEVWQSGQSKAIEIGVEIK
jgi:hypothetical protein